METMYKSGKLIGRMRAVVMIALACSAATLRADHAVTRDGKGLFNVIIDDNISTSSRPLRVQYRGGGQSFGYDFNTDNVFPLPAKHGSYFEIGDYVTTSTNVTKEQARALMRKLRWHKYKPAARAPLVPPTPAPETPTPRPTPVVGKEELADQALPIGDRVQQQHDKFLARQKELAASIEFAVKVQKLDPKKGKEMRLQLLDHQIKILKHYYNQTENVVAQALKVLKDQRKSVEEKGTFSHELMHGL